MLSSRGCEYFLCSNPTGLTISHDGRMYICDHSDTLTVREIDGSRSKLSLRPGPNKECIDNVCYARVCSDDGIVVHDLSGNVTKFTKDGEYIYRIKPPSSSPIRCFCLDSSDLLYCATSDQVKVYLPSGAFSHDMVLLSTLKQPNAIAIDKDNNVHVGFSSSIQVFSAKGKLIHEFGHDELRDVESIAISRENPHLVVATGYDLTKLFVFSSSGTFLYTVTGLGCGIDSSFDADNSLWIAEQLDNDLVCVPKLFNQLPPPLSYLCELSILPHLNELPVSLLPPRLAGLFKKWTQLVTVEIKCRSFTDYPSKSKLISDTIEFRVEPNAFIDMVKWLVEKKMNLKPSAITISHSGDKGVDFVVNDRGQNTA